MLLNGGSLVQHKTGSPCMGGPESEKALLRCLIWGPVKLAKMPDISVVLGDCSVG